MRDYPLFNFPLFEETTTRLRALGHSVFSPAEHDLSSGFDPARERKVTKEELRRMLAADMEYISLHADALCMLPGYQRSMGACAELSLAAAIGLLVGTIEDFEEGRAFPASDWFPIKSAQVTSRVSSVYEEQ